MSETLSFPIPRSTPLLPPLELDKLRLQGPAAKVRMWDGSEAWLVTRFKDVRAILLDNRFSEVASEPGHPMLSPARANLITNAVQLNQMRGEDHLRLRRMIMRLLTVKRVEAQRQTARRLVNELIDSMISDGGPVDFVARFALPIPTTLIADLLGVPPEDYSFLQAASHSRVQLDVPPDVPLAATRKMEAYFARLLRARETATSDSNDFLTRFAKDHVATGEMTIAEAATLAYTLVQAGHETTTNTIALGALMLMQNPDQLQLLLADPALVPGAVEEMLRYQSIVQYSISRVALADVEIGGTLIRKGEGLFALLQGANHDPEMFPEPHKFDIRRPARNHVAFGYGVHQCVGQQLARVELQEVFSTLFQRLPTLRLAVEFAELRFKLLEMNFGLYAMPVTW